MNALLLAAALSAANPYQSMKAQPPEFFHLIPQTGVTHLLTEDDDHNAIWDMAVSPEGRLFFGSCGETYVSVYARMYEYDPKAKRLIRHFDLEKRIAQDAVGLRASKFHTSMSFLGGGRMLLTTHTTSPAPDHPTWLPYSYYNHPFESFRGSDLLIWNYLTNETRGLGKFTQHDTVYGATYDPKNGDYFATTCLFGEGLVYNLHDGSIRSLGQVTDSRTSKSFLCSDGHIYGSTYSGALYRYNTDKRDIEYLGVHCNGLLRQAKEWNGVLYFFTGTCGKDGRGMMLYALHLDTLKLEEIGCPVPVAPRLDQYPPNGRPEYHAYAMEMDSKGRLWYASCAVTPAATFMGVKLFLWDFLRGGKPIDCGFLGSEKRTVSESASFKMLPGDVLVCSDGNHASWKEDACGIIAIELDRFVSALEDPSTPRLFSHDLLNYLPYPVECWRYYPKDDRDEYLAKFADYYTNVIVRFRDFRRENDPRLPKAGARGISVWEKLGRKNASILSLDWSAGGDTPKYVTGRRRKGWPKNAIPAELEGLELPAYPGRRYLAKPESAVRLADGSYLVGTLDGLLAHVENGRVRGEGGVMTGGGIHKLLLAPDGRTVWGFSGHDEGLSLVFSWSRETGLVLRGSAPDVTSPEGRNVHVYRISAMALSPDGRYLALGGKDELSGIVILPVP